jgi:hypothetical protein
MGDRQRRRRQLSRRTKRVLLVGLTPLMMDVLSGPLSDYADVSAVPFPGDAFEQAADEFGADLVLIDVTYLDEGLVRPMMLARFDECRPVLAFISERGAVWYDDLRTKVSGRLEDADADRLMALIGRPRLTLVK